jgi:hypothetical protein
LDKSPCYPKGGDCHDCHRGNTGSSGALPAVSAAAADAARGEAAAPTAAEAASAIVAEARAAIRAVLADVHSGYPGARTFLRVRLDRLARAAEEAVAAAREGDTAGLRRHLHRFEAVTSAIWTAQDAVCGPASSAGAHAGSE